ncbi:MAG: phospho-N-acetylmuramoyl-pentapeptide-transferase [Pseudomonadota bacterium]
MLYFVLDALRHRYVGFNVFHYISFRTIYAALTALTISLFLGPWLIGKLKEHQIGQYIREDGPQSHLSKKGTPTMGGLLILFAAVVSTLSWMDLRAVYVWVALFVMVGMGGIGFWDDYQSVTRKQNSGLTGRGKIGLQFAVALAAAVWLWAYPPFRTTLMVPFFKSVHPDLGLLYIPFAVLVIVGASNAVNLTDGLDGLAIGPLTVAFSTYLLFAYFSGHAKIAQYLQIAFVAGTGELAIFCAALVGAGMGFLWYNSYPAEVFMGDVGSLSLGGALGVVAIMTKQEMLLVLVGGIFVVEALSVIFQVGYFKISHGKRIFRMAPLHHHFELNGWPEPKVIVRFWIIGIILGLLSIGTLKLR